MCLIARRRSRPLSFANHGNKSYTNNSNYLKTEHAPWANGPSSVNENQFSSIYPPHVNLSQNDFTNYRYQVPNNVTSNVNELFGSTFTGVQQHQTYHTNLSGRGWHGRFSDAGFGPRTFSSKLDVFTLNPRFMILIDKSF